MLKHVQGAPWVVLEERNISDVCMDLRVPLPPPSWPGGRGIGGGVLIVGDGGRDGGGGGHGRGLTQMTGRQPLLAGRTTL